MDSIDFEVIAMHHDQAEDDSSSDLSDSDSSLNYFGPQDFMNAHLPSSSRSEDEESLPGYNDSVAEDNIWNTPHVRARCKTLYSKSNEYFASEEYTDVNITCDNRVFKCHRFVLASASEYFHLMFSGGFRERTDRDVVLHDIDSATFEQVLHCIYTGDLGVVDERNVYNLLRAGDLLRLQEVEERCTDYLLQCKIPTDYAFEIFSLAHVTRKNLLIPALSRFILAHLNRFCADQSFMKLSFDELNTLLRYSSCLTTCEVNEKALLGKVLQWALRSTGTREQRRNAFLELTRNIEFKHVPTAFIEEYFDKNTTDRNEGDGGVDTLSIEHIDFELDYREPSLFLYINGFDQVLRKYETFQASVEKHDAVLSWSRSRVIESPVEHMRSVVLDGQLYCLSSYDSNLSFRIHSPADLSQVSLLRAPPTSEHYSGLPFSMCHDDENIYFLNWYHKVYTYNRTGNTWSRLHELSNQRFFPTMMTCHDRRLYFIGSKPFKLPHRNRDRSTSDQLRAYDPRVGKLEVLASCKNPHNTYDDECCCHNGRIYVTQSDKRMTFMMDFYDFRAGKWDVLLRKAKRPHCFSFVHRIISFDHHLWLFYSDSKDNISYEKYNSFVQDWDAETTLNHVFDNQKCSRIMDAVVF